jgi:hypothetical protein
MPDPSLGVPDTYALRRRVLLTGVVTLAAFFLVMFLLAWLDGSDRTSNGWVIPLMAVIYLTITRPLMRPVREAIKLRRRLAYQAYLDEKERR